jgi:CRISPR-associated protein Cas1
VAGRAKLQELRDAGVDPAHGGEAGRKRSEKVAASNRRNPRKKPAKPKARASKSDKTFQPVTKEFALLYEERGRFWDEESETSPDPGRPLVLHGYGIRISVRRGVLVIWGRFEEETEEIRMYPGDPQLPPRIILHNSKASLSTDAMSWLVKQGITLVNVDYTGKALSLVGGMGEGARTYALAQMLVSKDPQTRIKIGRLLISEKTREQYNTLEETLGIREPHLRRTLGEIKRATDLEDLLQIEARAAAAYFRHFKGIEIRWIKTERFPVPESWYEIGSRAALSSNKNARHPANAMLNYAYRVLESDTLLAATSLGLDPYSGFLHVDKKGRASLVYDLMEPLRPQVDRKLIEMIRSRSLSAGDFFLHPSGVVRLNPKLATYLASEIHIRREEIERVAEAVLESLKYSVG